MITGFESITEDLTELELSLIPVLISGFKLRTKDNPIKAPQIIKAMKPRYKITEPRLRKLCNYIRSNSLLPLIATSRGYYVSYNPNEIENQVKSLRERAASILQSAKGIESFINK